MSNVIRGQADAFSPWDLASFDSAVHEAHANEPVRLPTLEQVAQIEEQARQDGFQAGHAEGFAAGRAEGEALGLAELRAEAERIRAIAESFSAAIRGADDSISRQVLELSLDLAKALLRTALPLHPDLILPIVREAILGIPSIRQPARLHLHPEDLPIVRERMGEELSSLGWLLVGDETLERGGCRAETADNQIDASLPTRWKRLASSLSSLSDWN